MELIYIFLFIPIYTKEKHFQTQNTVLQHILVVLGKTAAEFIKRGIENILYNISNKNGNTL